MGTVSVKKTQREERIISALQRKKRLTTREVADMLNVSECTVRRLFERMEERGEAVRVYGGVKLPPNKFGEYYFENLQLRQSEQKQVIGEYASHLVEDGDILFLDSGTTIQQMALSLAERFKRGELQDVRIFTNSLRNLAILMQHCKDINLIGGLFRSKRQDFCGYLSEMVLESISFEKCFLSADGIGFDADDGIMATDTFTAKINQIVSRRAGSIYLLADSTKFVRRSFIQFASVKDVKMIITDSSLPATMAEQLSKLGPIVKRL